MTSSELHEALRSLLLPISESNYRKACEAVADVLSASTVPVEDASAAIGNMYDSWRNDHYVPGDLVDVVRAALHVEPELTPEFKSSYFRIHKKLVDRHLLSFDNARGLLSHALMIRRLIQVEKMSCAQVANTLSSRRGDFKYSWQQVKLVARSLTALPRLGQSECEQVSERDLELEQRRLADASPLEAIELVAQRASELGYPGDMKVPLSGFYDPRASPKFEPAYSIILHANALTAEFYDHPPQEAAYEFEPRGGVIAWLQSTQHPSYEAGASAYLNNSKGAYAFDTNWAWGRKSGKWKYAHALSEILQGLGAMPYAGRRELAGWIRQWLLRIERERKGAVVRVPELNAAEAITFLKSMSRANTGTSGVLDQRALEFVSLGMHPTGDGWRARGLGDFVNASNTAKRKLGDIEFENAHEREIVAYEAHGGRLSDIYIEGHRSSLRKVLPRRELDLVQVAPKEDWKIKVVFVAHELGITSPADERIEGFPVTWELKTYQEVVGDKAEQLVSAADSVNRFNSVVVNSIQQPHVPDHVRRTFLDLSKTAQRTPTERFVCQTQEGLDDEDRI